MCTVRCVRYITNILLGVLQHLPATDYVTETEVRFGLELGNLMSACVYTCRTGACMHVEWWICTYVVV